MSVEPEVQWTTERQIYYPMITELALSPDGGRVVYAVREPLMTDDKSEYITHLYLVSTGDGEPVQLTFGSHSERCPRWSPDGRHLAFLSNRAGKDNLYSMRADGGEAWPLTAYEKTGIKTVEWAPDGKDIVFLMPEPPSEEKEKAEKARDDPILWEVDFHFVHLYRIPFAVGPRELCEARQITAGRFHVLNVDWFPDGTRLAITHRPTPVDEDWPRARLAIVPADLPQGSEAFGVDDLTDVGLIADYAADPKVSADGRWIACSTGDQPARWASANRVVLYPMDGGDPRPLAETPDAMAWMLGWSADGSHVYAYGQEGLSSQVVALPASCGPLRALTDSTLYKGPFSLNGCDQIAFCGQDLHQVNTIYLLDAKIGTTWQVLTPPMPARWPAGPLPRTEIVRWQAPDGLEIEGILTYPLQYQPGERYPLVVEVHGGPASVYSRQFLGWPNRYCNIAEMAERGFCVLRCNPRGSSGYGKAFRFANRGDWGGGDYHDIMAGVDYVIEEGVADPERMGIVGWSYGGYMTSWIITQTDRFGAACVGAGLTNLMSFSGTSDICGFIPDYFDSEFWEDLEPYRQHSALFQVKGVRTPTLIQHGQNDVRVPLSQGRELYNALKRQNVPVEMVIYPRQGHGIAEPRLWIDVRRRAIAWLERWLLNEGED